MPKENKQMLELGQKQRAGRVLSEYLRAIATEKTELLDVVIGPDKVERHLVSKGEALARNIWDEALMGGDSKIKLEYRKLILDRIEGKPAGPDDGEVTRRHASVPERVSEINRKKLNDLARGDGKKEKAKV